MKSILLVSIVLLLVCEINPQGFLRRSGKKIVNDNGEIILKGIGLGGWLVQEGYMLQTSSFANSQTQIRAKIEALIGKEYTDEFYAAYLKNFVTKKDIDSIAKWGFNSIRLPMHYAYLTPKKQPGVFIEEGFALIDTLLSWCEQNKIYLILDLHAAPGAQSKEGISDSDGEARLWLEEIYRTQTVELWRELARRYATKEWIGGYDLINETAYDLGSGSPMLKQLFVDITNAIRTVDNNHILFIEGNWFATDFGGLTPPWDNNMAYSFHKYWNGVNTSSIQYLLDIRNKQNVPLWLGESGENSNSWFTDCIILMQEQGIGWAWWTHKKVASISGLTSVINNPEYQVLLNYWKGQIAKPTVEYARTALMKLAQNLLIEKCTINYGVIDALLRQPDDISLIPFAENKIPGIIYGPEYDYGRRGVAFQDKVYEINGGMGSATYNNGWLFRNDGVDLELCSDWSSNGYNVGWIETGDWLKYTVDVTSSGTYDINVNIAANVSGGKFILKSDNTSISGTVDVPVTGGWQNWQNITIPDVPLTAGKHVLQIQFFFGGFNFNHIEFIQKTTSVESENVKKEFRLEQNYPNPFNPSTVIKYSIPDNGPVSLKLFDIVGNEVAELVSENQDSGKHEIKLDAQKHNLASGIYFYKLQSGSYQQTKKLILIK